ncbi:MAG: divalent-cation tolerance protein CutA [Candidatus Aminicenantales bacterium]
MKKYLLVLTTTPDRISAQKLASEVVKERLAACATISSACQSFYWWQGKINKDREYMLFIKTKFSLFSRLAKRISALHPYQLPEIISLPIAKGSADYLAWLDKEVA